jgi:Holliday junction DNA helicase RuvA
MIAGVRGVLEAQGLDAVVVGVGGLSLRVFAPSSTISRLPPVGAEIRLLTHLVVREDQLALYGFGTPEELALFEQLITVTGVGPRLALAILSAASSDVLRQAIAGENLEVLQKVPGIGKKLAGRLILELRGKLTAAPNGAAAAGPAPPADSDVLEALLGLGYAPADAQAALRSLPSGEQDLEQRIKLALQFFARRQ